MDEFRKFEEELNATEANHRECIRLLEDKIKQVDKDYEKVVDHLKWFKSQVIWSLIELEKNIF